MGIQEINNNYASNNCGRFLISQSGFDSSIIDKLNGGGSLSDREQAELTAGLQYGGGQYDSSSTSGSGQYGYSTASGYGQYGYSSAPGGGYGSRLNVNDAIDKFYYATYKWGTDNEDMESVLKGINSNNVMDYMKTWNKYHSKEKGESLMNTFMWDATGDQKVTYGRQISHALRDKAEQVGIYDEEMAEAFAQIDQELRSAYIGNDIYKKFDEIIYKIAEAEADKLAEAEPDEDKKAEVREKALEFAKPYEASTETKNGWDRFLSDTAEFFDNVGDALLGWM